MDEREKLKVVQKMRARLLKEPSEQRHRDTLAGELPQFTRPDIERELELAKQELSKVLLNVKESINE